MDVVEVHRNGQLRGGQRSMPEVIAQVKASEYGFVVRDIPDAIWCRDLRGPSEVFGRAKLGGRDQRKIREANALLSAAVCLCRAMQLLNRTWVLLRASVGRGGGASIWDTDVVQGLY